MVLHNLVIQAPSAQYAAVDLGMQGLDPTAHYFRKAGVFRDFFNCNTLIGKQAGGTAGGQDFDA